MNTQLTNHFLNMQPHLEMMQATSYQNIISELDKHFNRQWAWEITDEKLIMDGTMVSTTVAVYVPGRVMTGRALAKIKDYEDNHLHALVNACAVITTSNASQKVVSINQNPNPQSMSPEQIMAMVETFSPQPPADSAAVRVDDYLNAQQRAVTNDAAQQVVESQPLQQQNNCTTPAPQQPFIDYDSSYNQPNPALNGYSQCQIDRMNRIKQEMDIVNDAMLGKWINTWNSSYSSKKDLNPMNIDMFMDWVEDFSKKMYC